ncbi:MAG: type II secretion system F family protein, partial [Paraclostridium sp.]
MKTFKYEAINLSGKKTKGNIEANDFKEARKLLKDKKLKVLDIKESHATSFKSSNKKKKLKADQISHFCRQFSIILSSGINSIIGLETLGKKTDNKILASEINRIVNDIKRGS